MEMQQEHPKPGPQTVSGVRPPTSSMNPVPQPQQRGDRRQLCTLGLGFLSCDVPLATRSSKDKASERVSGQTRAKRSCVPGTLLSLGPLEGGWDHAALAGSTLFAFLICPGICS